MTASSDKYRDQLREMLKDKIDVDFDDLIDAYPVYTTADNVKWDSIFFRDQTKVTLEQIRSIIDEKIEKYGPSAKFNVYCDDDGVSFDYAIKTPVPEHEILESLSHQIMWNYTHKCKTTKDKEILKFKAQIERYERTK